MELFIMIGSIFLVLFLALGAFLFFNWLERRHRLAAKTRFEGKIPSNAVTLGKKIQLLFAPNVRNKRRIQEIMVEQVHQILGQPVIVHVSPPAQSRTFDDGNFHVLLGAGADAQLASITRPGYLFDVACDGEAQACQSSGKGFPIVDPKTGFIAGELFDNRLYIHVDVLNGGQHPQLKLLEAVMGAVGVELKASKEVKTSLLCGTLSASIGSVPDEENSSTKVTVEGYDDARLAELMAQVVRSTLLPGIKKPIVVINARGNAAAPVMATNDTFNVFVHSAPAGESTTSLPPNRYWSHVPLTQKCVFQPSGLSMVVYDNDHHAVGEVMDNNLYIHYQALEAGTYTELALLELFFKQAIVDLKRLETRRAEYTNIACNVLPSIADKLEVHIDSRFVRPLEPGRFHIYCFPAGNPPQLSSCWNESKGGSVKPFAPLSQPRWLWLSDRQILEIVDENRFFLSIDWQEKDRDWENMRARLFSSALAVLGSELAAFEYLALNNLLADFPATGNQKFTFIENGLSGMPRDLLETVTKQIAMPRVSGKSVRLVNSNGKNNDPSFEGDFSIFLDSAPRGEKNTWGLSTTGLGGILVVEPADDLKGELVGDNFYLHSCAMRRGTWTEAAGYARFLLRAFEVREMLEQDKREIESLACEILAETVTEPIMVYTGSKVVDERDRRQRSLRIFFAGYSEGASPAANWSVRNPEGLVSLKSDIQAGLPIIDDDNCVLGEIAGDDVFLSVDVAPGSTGTDMETRLVYVLNQLKTNLEYRTRLGKVFEQARQEDAGLPVPLNMVRAGFFPSPHSERLMVSLCEDLLLRRVGTDIEVTCAGRPFEPVDDGKFHVFVASAVEKEKLQARPDSIFGHAVGSSSPCQSFIPSAHGEPIVDEETGFVVGELFGRNLYMFENLTGRGTFKDAMVAARFLLAARKRLAGESGNIVERQFVRDCIKQFESTEWVPGSLVEVRRNLRNMLIQAQKNENNYYRPDLGADQLGEEFDQLVKSPKVKDVTVTGGTLAVCTKTLYCTDPRNGNIHEIGAFKIRFDLSKCNVNWENLTRRIDGGVLSMHGPHIDSSGRGCLGNTTDVFPELIRKRELVSAVELAIAFVETVAPDDPWGKQIGNWPRVSRGDQ